MKTKRYEVWQQATVTYSKVIDAVDEDEAIAKFSDMRFEELDKSAEDWDVSDGVHAVEVEG